MLLLNAEDDPICAASGFPHDKIRGNSNVRQTTLIARIPLRRRVYTRARASSLDLS